MIESGLLVSTAIQGYKWLQGWHKEQANPPHLPQHAILAFQRFKNAYDGKNIHKLGLLISTNYRGDVFGVTTKQAYLNTQTKVFEALPWFINPCLCINVYSIVHDTHKIFVPLSTPNLKQPPWGSQSQLMIQHLFVAAFAKN